MPKIPGPESLGRVKPQSGQVVSMQLGRESKAKAQAAQSDPMGGVITQLGGQALDMAARQREREDRLAVVTKKSEFTQKMIGFESGLDGDTDYQTYGKRFHDEMQKAKRDAIGGVENDFMRKTLEADLNLDISQGLSRVGKRSWGSEKEHGLKEMNDVLARNRELSLNTDDPKLRESLLNDMKRAIAISVDNDYLDEDQGGELNRQVAIGTAEAIISMRPAQEQIAMLKSGDGIAEAIPSDRRKQLLDKVDTRGISQEKADDIWLSGKDDAAMLKEAEKIKDPKIRDDTKSRIKTRINEREGLKKQKESDAYDASMAIIVQPDNNSLDAIPPKVWETMSGTGQTRVRDYVEARAEKAAKGRNKDDPYIAFELDKAFKSGQIKTADDMEMYRPYLKDSTYRIKLAMLELRDVVSSADMEAAFSTRLGKDKSRADWSEEQGRQYVAYQDFVSRNINKSGRPSDLESLTDRWFMGGEGLQDAYFTNDPNTLGESITAGRKDFLLAVPDSDKAMVGQAMAILKGSNYFKGMEKESPDDIEGVFYTNTFTEGSDFLEGNNYPVTPKSIAVYAALKKAGKPLTITNIKAGEAFLNE